MTRSLVELCEEFSGGRDRRLIVARFASRWFVLAGFHAAELGSYGVTGPFDHHGDAVRAAVRMHDDAAMRGREVLQVVEE